MKNWQYKLRNYTSLENEVFEGYFDDMPYDPYVKGHFRKRRFSRFKLDHFGEIEVLPHKKFIQTSKVNDLLGDVEREYEEIDENLVKTKEFDRIFKGFLELAKVNAYLSEIGIHQIRILSSIYIDGEPAPEGRHQDGFDFIGIFCSRRKWVDGGKSELYLKKTDEKPLLSKILKENEMLVVNDKAIFHTATKLSPTTNELGYRDVFVFTA